MGTTLYKNADWIITMNEKREKIRHGDLLISGKEILDVGTDLEKKYEGTLKIDHVVEAEGTVILPGFVNVHHHTWAVSDPQYPGNKRTEAGTVADCYV